MLNLIITKGSEMMWQGKIRPVNTMAMDLLLYRYILHYSFPSIIELIWKHLWKYVQFEFQIILKGMRLSNSPEAGTKK